MGSICGIEVRTSSGRSTRSVAELVDVNTVVTGSQSLDGHVDNAGLGIDLEEADEAIGLLGAGEGCVAWIIGVDVEDADSGASMGSYN